MPEPIGNPKASRLRQPQTTVGGVVLHTSKSTTTNAGIHYTSNRTSDAHDFQREIATFANTKIRQSEGCYSQRGSDVIAPFSNVFAGGITPAGFDEEEELKLLQKSKMGPRGGKKTKRRLSPNVLEDEEIIINGDENSVDDKSTTQDQEELEGELDHDCGALASGCNSNYVYNDNEELHHGDRVFGKTYAAAYDVTQVHDPVGRDDERRHQIYQIEENYELSDVDQGGEHYADEEDFVSAAESLAASTLSFGIGGRLPAEGGAMAGMLSNSTSSLAAAAAVGKAGASAASSLIDDTRRGATSYRTVVEVDDQQHVDTFDRGQGPEINEAHTFVDGRASCNDHVAPPRSSNHEHLLLEHAPTSTSSLLEERFYSCADREQVLPTSASASEITNIKSQEPRDRVDEVEELHDLGHGRRDEGLLQQPLGPKNMMGEDIFNGASTFYEAHLDLDIQAEQQRHTTSIDEVEDNLDDLMEDWEPLDIVELEANSTIDELWTLLFQNYDWLRQVEKSLKRTKGSIDRLAMNSGATMNSSSCFSSPDGKMTAASRTPTGKIMNRSTISSNSKSFLNSSFDSSSVAAAYNSPGGYGGFGSFISTSLRDGRDKMKKTSTTSRNNSIREGFAGIRSSLLDPHGRQKTFESTPTKIQMNAFEEEEIYLEERKSSTSFNTTTRNKTSLKQVPNRNPASRSRSRSPTTSFLNKTGKNGAKKNDNSVMNIKSPAATVLLSESEAKQIVNRLYNGGRPVIPNIMHGASISKHRSTAASIHQVDRLHTLAEEGEDAFTSPFNGGAGETETTEANEEQDSNIVEITDDHEDQPEKTMPLSPSSTTAKILTGDTTSSSTAARRDNIAPATTGEITTSHRGSKRDLTSKTKVSRKVSKSPTISSSKKTQVTSSSHPRTSAKVTDKKHHGVLVGHSGRGRGGSTSTKILQQASAPPDDEMNKASTTENQVEVTKMLRTLEKQRRLLEQDLEKIREDTTQIELLVARRQKEQLQQQNLELVTSSVGVTSSSGIAAVAEVAGVQQEREEKNDDVKASVTSSRDNIDESEIVHQEVEHILAGATSNVASAGGFLPQTPGSSVAVSTRTSCRPPLLPSTARLVGGGGSSTTSANLQSDLGTKLHGVISRAVSREVNKISRSRGNSVDYTVVSEQQQELFHSETRTGSGDGAGAGSGNATAQQLQDGCSTSGQQSSACSRSRKRSSSRKPSVPSHVVRPAAPGSFSASAKSRSTARELQKDSRTPPVSAIAGLSHQSQSASTSALLLSGKDDSRERDAQEQTKRNSTAAARRRSRSRRSKAPHEHLICNGGGPGGAGRPLSGSRAGSTSSAARRSRSRSTKVSLSARERKPQQDHRSAGDDIEQLSEGQVVGQTLHGRCGDTYHVGMMVVAARESEREAVQGQIRLQTSFLGGIFDTSKSGSKTPGSCTSFLSEQVSSSTMMMQGRRLVTTQLPTPQRIVCSTATGAAPAAPASSSLYQNYCSTTPINSGGGAASPINLSNVAAAFRRSLSPPQVGRNRENTGGAAGTSTASSGAPGDTKIAFPMGGSCSPLAAALPRSPTSNSFFKTINTGSFHVSKAIFPIPTPTSPGGASSPLLHRNMVAGGTATTPGTIIGPFNRNSTEVAGVQLFKNASNTIQTPVRPRSFVTAAAVAAEKKCAASVLINTCSAKSTQAPNSCSIMVDDCSPSPVEEVAAAPGENKQAATVNRKAVVGINTSTTNSSSVNSASASRPKISRPPKLPPASTAKSKREGAGGRPGATSRSSGTSAGVNTCKGAAAVAAACSPNPSNCSPLVPVALLRQMTSCSPGVNHHDDGATEGGCGISIRSTSSRTNDVDASGSFSSSVVLEKDARGRGTGSTTVAQQANNSAGGPASSSANTMSRTASGSRILASIVQPKMATPTSSGGASASAATASTSHLVQPRQRVDEASLLRPPQNIQHGASSVPTKIVLDSRRSASFSVPHPGGGSTSGGPPAAQGFVANNVNGILNTTSAVLRATAQHSRTSREGSLTRPSLCLLNATNMLSFSPPARNQQEQMVIKNKNDSPAATTSNLLPATRASLSQNSNTAQFPASNLFAITTPASRKNNTSAMLRAIIPAPAASSSKIRATSLPPPGYCGSGCGDEMKEKDLQLQEVELHIEDKTRTLMRQEKSQKLPTAGEIISL
ncbi:unnamed protein product [Amoebophrya sp. A120]|nr:unnamed protein product [Amoebophrya sp. A120]|eukprot:GSA120T00022281001.1